MKVSIGGLYTSNKCSIIVFESRFSAEACPDGDVAAKENAGFSDADFINKSGTILATFLGRHSNARVWSLDVATVFMIVETAGNPNLHYRRTYFKVLAGEILGWIVYQPWLEIVEVA